jgi:hypothetical protein
MAKREDLTIVRGKTFSLEVRWEELPIVYKAITAIAQTAPALITATGHGLKNGWRVAVVSVKGMAAINAGTPVKDKDYHAVTIPVADGANKVELNDVNAADFKPYTSGGYLQYNSPASLAGFAARMSIKDKVGGTELLRLDTTLVAPQPRIALDDDEHTITLTLSATETADITWTKGVYDLELVSALGVVTLIIYGAVAVGTEVTT